MKKQGIWLLIGVMLLMAGCGINTAGDGAGSSEDSASGGAVSGNAVAAEELSVESQLRFLAKEFKTWLVEYDEEGNYTPFHSFGGYYIADLNEDGHLEIWHSFGSGIIRYSGLEINETGTGLNLVDWGSNPGVGEEDISEDETQDHYMIQENVEIAPWTPREETDLSAVAVTVPAISLSQEDMVKLSGTKVVIGGIEIPEDHEPTEEELYEILVAAYEDMEKEAGMAEQE
ncbi:MAG: hypothetical protein J1F02_04250 [Lachnospiraceae bacterium]|nr:hypothetical protein [Lachnospiraceae bacterium]